MFQWPNLIQLEQGKGNCSNGVQNIEENKYPNISMIPY